ncbi:MAG TPA: tetratricopeptide repeat protein [Candidatus Polarisedimenticolia bacterium]|nr:tetratricopeptide repeat protein [Candidatus Polarisedimenticolia bacterium]
MAHYTSHYLAEIIRDLFFDESSGVLAVAEPAGRRVRLHFDRGMLYFADGTTEDEQLDAVLRQSGFLPQGTLAKLKAASPDPLEMAQRLAAGKIIAPAEMAPLVRSVVERGVQRAFSWPSGLCEFQRREPCTGFFDPDVLFTFECLLKGIAGMAHFGPLKDVLLRLPGRLALNEKVFIPVDRLSLAPHHGYLLSRVDGSMRIDEIAMVLPPAEEDASLLFLYGLAVLGIVKFVPPVNNGPFSLREVVQDHYDAAAREDRDVSLIKETCARVMKQSPPEVLGLPAGADLPVIQKAYDEARSLFRRDRFPERVREKLKRELTLIENKLAESFLKLQVERLERAGGTGQGEPGLSAIDTDSLMVRREMVKTEAQAAQEQNAKLAERYYQKARDYFAEKDFHNCIQFCRLAIKFHSESAPAYALMAEALARNPHSRWQRMAEEAFQKACELDPWNAEHHVALGMFYKTNGMGIRARRQFEKALEILPSHAAAMEGMKDLRRRG